MLRLAEQIHIKKTTILSQYGASTQDLARAGVALVLLAAGKGTRYGQQPKCIADVDGKPLARHTIDEFKTACDAPTLCVVGYRFEDVASALGVDNIYVLSSESTGGTGYAAFEIFLLPELLERDPLLVIAMGDRIIPAPTIRALMLKHGEGNAEADLTFLTAHYESAAGSAKGRIVRDSAGRVAGISEQHGHETQHGAMTSSALIECNCPLYVCRAALLHTYLSATNNDNVQGQYYLTDIVADMHKDGLDIRTLTVGPDDDAYCVLCADVTRKADLVRLEQEWMAYVRNHA